MDKWDRKTDFNCNSCMFYVPKRRDSSYPSLTPDQLEKYLRLGRCQRRAPTLQGYPVVYGNKDWCGEHKIGSNPVRDRKEKPCSLSHCKKCKITWTLASGKCPTCQTELYPGKLSDESLVFVADTDGPPDNNSKKDKIQIGKSIFGCEIDGSIPDDTFILKSRKTGKVVAKIINIGKEDG